MYSNTRRSRYAYAAQKNYGHYQAKRLQKDDTSQIAQKTRVRSIQLVLCILLFCGVYLGNIVFPEKMEKAQSEILDFIEKDTDFRAAFYDLGLSLSEKESVLGDVGTFCVEVFGGGQMQKDDAVIVSGDNVQLPQNLGSVQENVNLTNQLLLTQQAKTWVQSPQIMTERTYITQEEITTPRIYPVGSILRKVSDSKRAVPEGYTLDYISLGEIEMSIPVLGTLNSEFGCRNNPVNKQDEVHRGVDIGGKTGDPIISFSAGTVVLVTENKSYGKHVKIDHGNGITTVYAHCSKVLVKEGQKVAAGERIALVGATGNVTGPHLHFEIRHNGTFLDPAHYISFQTRA